MNNQHDSLSQAFHMGAAMFEASPHATILFDERLNAVYCNGESTHYFGFASKKDLLEGFADLIESSIPPSQPDGRPSMTLKSALATAMRDGALEIISLLNLHDKSVQFDVNFKRLDIGGHNYIALYMAERRESDEHMQLMLDAMPMACCLVDENLKAVDCNMATVRLAEAKSKQEFLDEYWRIFPEFQPDGDRSLDRIWEMRAQAPDTGHITFDFSFKTLTGADVPTEITLQHMFWRGSDRIAVYCRDLREIRYAADELKKYSSLLLAINTVAANLISAVPDQFERAIWEALRHIGKTVDVDRVYIWENFGQGGKTFSKQTFEWSEGADPQQGKDFAMALDYDDIPMWKKSVWENKPINSPVRDLPVMERGILEQQGIISILVIPVYHQGKPWGYIGFDDCRTERTFSKIEENVLLSGGILMISAIIRNSMTRQLIDAGGELSAQDSLLRAVNAVAALLMEDSNADDFHAIIMEGLRILGTSVDADRAYIWKNNIWNGRLCFSQYAEWAKTTLSPLGSIPPVNMPYDDFYPGWEKMPINHFVINAPVSQLSESITAFPGIQDVKSISILPIVVQGEFWGFVGFDDCRNERVLTDKQIDILKSGGLLIASGIVRNEMTERLIETREEAIKSAKAKSEFLSRMSHEIRTPMNAVIGMTTLARKSADLERVQYYLQKVDSSSRQLLGIINDVLDMSKIDADKLVITENEFNFEEMMENVFNVIQVRVEEKHQNFQFDFPHVFTRKMITDELRLSQVLVNLLSNSVKFTPENGAVTLKVEEMPVRADTSRLRVSVTDNGIGIDPGRVPHLFDSFEQADGGITRQYGGTGLGLAISKKIVELMGGHIWVESEPGKGSRFNFEVDVKWGGEILTAVSADALPENLKILVIDDTPDVLDYFTNILSSFHLPCDTAENSEQALAAVQKMAEAGNAYD
ncbi:MAG: GAF domain-containing protein, partial [Oscillospiraceae bacterium]|nr:GAF domain-containing protein [Oscillospiraceae bacterium]